MDCIGSGQNDDSVLIYIVELTRTIATPANFFILLERIILKNDVG